MFCPNKLCIYDGSFDGKFTKISRVSEIDPKHVATIASLLDTHYGGDPERNQSIAREMVEKTCGLTVVSFKSSPSNLDKATAHFRKVTPARVGDVIEVFEERGPWRVISMRVDVRSNSEATWISLIHDTPGGERLSVPLGSVKRIVRMGTDTQMRNPSA